MGERRGARHIHPSRGRPVPAGEAPPPEDLLTHAAEHLAAFKRPRAVRFVESLPRNALGKLLGHELRP